MTNLLEKTIKAISPNWALKRLQANTALAYAGYQGASRRRNALKNYNPSSGDVNADTIPDLARLRTLSADLERNNLLAGGAINTLATNIVGTGLTMRPNINAQALGITDDQAAAWSEDVAQRFELWYGSTDCHAERLLNGYQLQDVALRGALVRGDMHTFCTQHRVDGEMVPALQLIEADRICNPGLAMDTPRLTAGVETNTAGAAVRYHICNVHPGVYNGQDHKWQAVDAFNADTGLRNIVPLFHATRPGQVRGIPILAALIEPLKQLGRYTEYELEAAVISGTFAIFTTVDAATFSEMFDPDLKESYLKSAAQWDGTLEGSGGKAVRMLPGETAESPAPGRPNSAFDPFFIAIARQIGAYLGIPLEMLIKHYTSSYSAAKAAMLDAWRMFKVRREMLASMHCQYAYEYWLHWDIVQGRTLAPGYMQDRRIKKLWQQANWEGDGMPSINPLQDANAAGKRVEIGLTTLDSESIAYDGKPWSEKHKQRAKEKKARIDGGLEVDANAV